MRKTLLLALAALSQLAAGAQTLLTADFDSQEDFAKWTVVDANADGSTWQYAAENDPGKRTFYNYNSDNAADDWLVSPAITADKDCKLMFTFTAKGGGDYYSESMDAWYGTAPTPSALTNKGTELTELKSKEKTGIFLIELKAGVPVYVGLHATSPAGFFRINLKSAKAEVNDNPVNLTTKAILSPVTGKDLGSGQTVTITVENNGQTTVSSFTAGFSYDGSDIVTEQVDHTLQPGESFDYTFSHKADLSTPRKSYTFDAWVSVEGDYNSSDDHIITQVKNIMPATVPYKLGFEADEDVSGLLFYNLNNDDLQWKILTNSSGFFGTTWTDRGSRCLGIGYNKEMAADDWAVLEGISITEPGYYALKFWYAADESHPEKLAVWWGNGNTPEDMTNKVVEYAPFLSPKGYKQSSTVVHFDKAQTVYFGFHGFSDANENWLTIDDVELTRVESTDNDLALSALATPAEWVHANSSKNIAYTVTNLGINDMKARVEVKVDGESMATRSVSVPAQKSVDVAYTNALASLSEGEHTMEVTLTADGDANAGNNSLSRTFRIMPEAVNLWDFEDGKLPSDFTFRAEDKGTINPAAGDDFSGNMSWSLMETDGSNWQIGSYILSGTSYIDNVSKADRWVILPKTTVTNDQWYLVWDARAFNEKYVESYEVHVSETNDERWDYSKIFSQPMEDAATVQTHGVSLAQYAGKDVYIAFRLNSRPGDRLLLDNIGLYNLTPGVTAIGGAAADKAAAVTYDATTATATAPGATAMAVTDLAGRTVILSNGPKADLSSLPAGLYIVKAEGFGAVKVRK